MLRFFPDNYTWSLAASLVVGMGGQPSEVESACGPLRAAGDETPEAWGAAWNALAERVEALASEDESRGHLRSAGEKLLRAAAYRFAAERLLDLGPAKTESYDLGMDAFRRGIEASGRRVEFVEVPYEDTSLPALLLPAQGADGPAPAMIHFDGFDVTKEILYLTDADGLAERGVTVLIVDHPGVGEALRRRNLPLRHDMEVPAAACLEYLAARDEVDAGRIGVIGISLGGYYAPRAAAFEPRLACCVCWGALYDTPAVVAHMTASGAESVPEFQKAWVLGVDTAEDIRAAVARLTLDGVMEHVRCPLLVVHGEEDHQVPLEQAIRTYEEAVNSSRRELKVFTQATGGAQHCQIDNPTLATQWMHDWIADVLEARSGTAALSGQAA